VTTCTRAKPKSHRRSQRIVVQPHQDPHKLVPRDEIRRGSLLILKEADRLLWAFPGRMLPKIMAEPDPTKRRAILDHECRRMVRRVEAVKNALVDKLFSTEH
jgi:hypothetical protein